MSGNDVLRLALAGAGMTANDLADRIGVDPKTVQRWVSRGRVPHPRHRFASAEVLGQPIDTLWPEAVRRAAWFRPWVEIEREATSLRSFEVSVIPGLLQTEAYARAVLGSGPLAGDDVVQFVTARLERQAATLDRLRPPLTTFVIDEAALRRGDLDIMADQLRHLVEVGKRPGILIHIVPLAAGAHPGQAGSFVIARLGNEEMGYLDDQLQGRVVTDANHIAELQCVWETIRAVALPRDQSAELILEVAQR